MPKKGFYLAVFIFSVAVLACFLHAYFFITKRTARAQTPPDAIAVRVIPNPDYYSPQSWYREQAFSGSPQSLTVDGYPAVRDGRTVYVNAGNVIGGVLYTNIYVISYNQEAESATVDIFGNILKSWKFNRNLTALGQCIDTKTTNCLNDAGCPEGEYCTSLKARVTRDTIRLADLADACFAIRDYQSKNGYYPKLEAGTYIPNRTLSTWPSWQQELGKATGFTMPKDPINKLGGCYGYDPVTCWNEHTKTFATDLPILPGYSRAYQYSSSADGSAYNVCAVMESGLVPNNPPLNCPTECSDFDGDGYGNPMSSDCEFIDLDCDDNNPRIHPGAGEDCLTPEDDDCDNRINCEDSDCQDQIVCTVPCADNVCNHVCGFGCTAAEDPDCECIANGCCTSVCPFDPDCGGTCTPGPCDSICNSPLCTPAEDSDCGCDTSDSCCSLGCVSSDPACVNCSDECSTGAYTCLSGDSYTCSNCDTDDCYEYCLADPCGVDGCDPFGNWFCQDSSTRQRDRTCHYRGCSGGACFDNPYPDSETFTCLAPLTCINGNCIDNCSDECNPGQTTCTSDDVYTCGECDIDSCRDFCLANDCGVDGCDPFGNWFCQDSSTRRRDQTCHYRGCSGGACFDNTYTNFETSACTAGDTCSAGNCVTVCTDECNIGDIQCTSDDVYNCSDCDPDPCLELCLHTDCGVGSCDPFGNWYCQDANTLAQDQTCHYRGCSGGACFDNPYTNIVTSACPTGTTCSGGTCGVFATVAINSISDATIYLCQPGVCPPPGNVYLPITFSTTANAVTSNPPIIYSLSGQPAFISIDSSSGLIQGTPMNTSDLGAYSITVTATVLGTVSDSTTFNLTVLDNQWCGDSLIQGSYGEACDDGAANGTPCTPAYGSSCTYCGLDCQPVTIPGGSCGDGTIQSPNEECDSGDLGGQTCVDFGFGGGSLACAADCTIDTSGCCTPVDGGWTVPLESDYDTSHCNDVAATQVFTTWDGLYAMCSNDWRRNWTSDLGAWHACGNPGNPLLYSCFANQNLAGACHGTYTVTPGNPPQWTLFAQDNALYNPDCDRYSVTCTRYLNQQTAARTCTNPAPSCGGANCIGPTTVTQSCGIQCFQGNWITYEWYYHPSPSCYVYNRQRRVMADCSIQTREVNTLTSHTQGSCYVDTGSTPFLFTYTGDNYYIENHVMDTFVQYPDMTIAETENAYKKNIFGHDYQPQDYYKLKLKPEAKNSILKLRINEIEPEESQVDRARLIKAVYNSEDLIFSDDSTIYAAEIRETEPISCIDDKGDDCLKYVAAADNEVMKRDQGRHITLEFEFDKIPENTYLSIISWGDRFIPEPITGPVDKGDSASLFFTSYKKDGEWRLIDKHFHPRGLKSEEYEKVDLEDYIENNKFTLKVEWSRTHSIDKINIMSATEKPFKQEVLELVSATHSRDGGVIDKLRDKDYDYAHLVRGDTIELEFEAGEIKPGENETVDYFFVTEGFYHGLRKALYPDIDTSDIYEEEIENYVKELNNYLGSK